MEINRTVRAVAIADQSQIGQARRVAGLMVAEMDFNDTDAGKVAISVTEAASNILKHGRGGEILLRPVQSGIEMLAIDKGPGIANLPRALEGGYSTTGTQGIGLGAISRLASAIDIYTAPGSGTAILARFLRSDRPRDSQPDDGLELGVAQAPYPGEQSCGDAWACAGSCVFVADGLGHGEYAAVAAQAAVEAFEENHRLTPSAVINAVHLALRSTRGAAVALARLDMNTRTVRFCGLGNISGSVITGAASRSMVSHNGTAGHIVPRLAEYECPWPPGALMVLHSDGISAKWDLQAYPGLADRDPSLVAGVIFRDFRRPRDDATVLVVRERAQAVFGGAH